MCLCVHLYGVCSLTHTHVRTTNRNSKTLAECKSWAHSLPMAKTGNPTWRKHVNVFHRFFLVGLIHQMALNCVPLQEEGVCEIATQLAYQNLKEFHHGELEPTRWNGIFNTDGSTTGICMHGCHYACMDVIMHDIHVCMLP